MIGTLFTAFHRTFYGIGQMIADACDRQELCDEAPAPVVQVRAYTRNRPRSVKRDALHAKLRQELGRAS